MINLTIDKSKAITQRNYAVELPYIDIKQRARSKQWVNFDRDNLYPARVYNMYKESPLQSAIINNQVKYTYGAGLADYDASIFSPNLTERWEDLIKKCIQDYCIFQSFAIQIIPNESMSKYSFFHIPVNQVRLGAYNEENVIEYAYLATDWSQVNNKNVIEIKMWGTEQPQAGERYLWYCKPYDPDELFYAVPKWMSCANWILADIALSKYYLNYIKNNFSSNLAIKYPQEVDDDKKKEIYDMLVASFAGEENAGNILLLFGENGVLPEVGSIESVDADLYNQVTDVVLKYICSGNRLSSPMLAGLNTSSGFSSKSDEIIAAYILYKITVIDEIRDFVLNKINTLLQLNGYPRCLVLQDYDFVAEFNGNTVQNDEKEKEQTNTDEDAANKDDQITEQNKEGGKV
jgi:hypothetical protein